MRSALYKGEEIKGMKPPVSVVIAARNEAQNLPVLLSSIALQDYPEFEVVLVLDRCSDNSLRLAQEAGLSNLKVLEVSEVPPGWNGKKYALKKGIESAKYDCLLFTDGDCRPYRNKWISSMAGKFDNDTVSVIGYGGYFKEKGLLGSLIWYDTLYTAIQYFSLNLAGIPYMGVGRNLAYRKSAYLKSDGMEKINTITGGDDDLMVQNLSPLGKIKPNISGIGKTVSTPSRNFKEFFFQKVRHMNSGRFYRTGISILLALLNFSRLFFYIFFFIGLFSGTHLEWLLSGLFLRTILFISIFVLVARKLNDMKEWYIYIPFLDLLHVVQYWVTGLSAVVCKRSSWT